MKVRTRPLWVSLLVGRLPSLSGSGESWPRWVLSGPVLIAVLALVPGAVLVAGLVQGLLRKRPDRLLAVLALLATGTLSAVLLAAPEALWPAWQACLTGRPARADLAAVLSWSLILGLPAGPAWHLADQAHRERQPMGGPVETARRLQVEAKRKLAWTHTIQSTAMTEDGWKAALAGRLAVPDTHPDGVVLGRKLAGDLGWKRTRYGVLLVPKKVLHWLILGGTGSGKSEVVWRIIEGRMREAAPPQIIYLNAKQPGATDRSPSDRLESMADQYGLTFRRLSRGEQPWDPMRGTNERIHQRLMAAQEWSEPWYQTLSSVVLRLALEIAGRKGQTPDSLADLVHAMLTGAGLKSLAKEDDLRARAALSMIDEADNSGTVTRLMDQAMQLDGWIGPASAGGWSWEDADVIAVDLPSGTDHGSAKQLLRLMLTDLEGWITESRRPKRGNTFRELVLIIEEVGALDGDAVVGTRLVNLSERARSSLAQLAVIAQDTGGLGDERAQNALLTNCTVVTGRQSVTGVIDQLVGLAGTTVHAEASVSYTSGVDPVAGSMRAQHVYKVDPNLIRNLGVGEIVVIDRGHWAHVAVAMNKRGFEPPGRPAIEPPGEPG